LKIASMSFLVVSPLFWVGRARADHHPAPVLAFALRSWSFEAFAVRERLPLGFGSRELELVASRDLGIASSRTIFDFFDFRTSDRMAELENPLFVELGGPAWGRFGGDPFERKAFDFQRKCLNPCPLGGWGTCVIDTRATKDDCEAIASRSLVSAAARRAPLVRDVLKLVGSKTTRLPTDADRGLHLAVALFHGGATLGIEAKF
jgi:hypothetical protein